MTNFAVSLWRAIFPKKKKREYLEERRRTLRDDDWDRADVYEPRRAPAVVREYVIVKHNKVLMFPDEKYPCNQTIKQMVGSSVVGCRNRNCPYLHNRTGERPSSMLTIIEYLAGAKKSIDLCIYLFTQFKMADVLCTLHKKGIAIRIITDRTETQTNSQIEKLLSEGIPIKSKVPSEGALMHHKFVVVDRMILLTGSFNWTKNAILHNNEAVTVTSNVDIVKPFIREFENLWRQFPDHPKLNTSEVKEFRNWVEC